MLLLPARRCSSISRRLRQGEGRGGASGAGDRCGTTRRAAGSRPQAGPSPVAELSDGAIIVAAGEAYTVALGRAFLRSGQGYQAARQIPRADGLLTPLSTLLAIRAGYRPMLHPDIEENLRF
jgi:hypothetical protein